MSRGLRTGRRPVVATLVAGTLAIAGCAGVPTSPKQVLEQSAKVSAAIAQLTQGILGKWCPPAFHAAGQHLTHREAVGCLTRAKNDYLGILHKAGFDPSKVVNGPP
jgi:hypothetical protein